MLRPPALRTSTPAFATGTLWDGSLRRAFSFRLNRDGTISSPFSLTLLLRGFRVTAGLPGNLAADPATPAAAAPPAAGALLKFFALAACLFAWLTLSFGGCTAGQLAPLHCRCRPLRAFLTPVWPTISTPLRGSSAPAAPSTATTLGAFFAAIGWLGVCELF
jgi:hypothetical protein